MAEICERKRKWNMINISEICVANIMGTLLMVFLILTRKENKEDKRLGEWLFDTMVWTTMVCCVVEIITFLLDGVPGTGMRPLNYCLNTILFLGTCLVGCLWCFYVEFRIYHSYSRLKKRKYLLIPLAIDVVLLFINLFGTNIIFYVSEDNVYSRGAANWFTFVVLFFYFVYSILSIIRSRTKGIRVKFFPIAYFVVPCMVGTVLQGMFYGLTTGWMAVSVALLFVYIQLQNENSFVDALTGLYNRKYMDYILGTVKRKSNVALYGIMLDMDYFKTINDNYGHSMGDEAIRDIAKVLSRTISDNGITLRFAGDEFIILLQTESREEVEEFITRIRENAAHFNQHSNKPYQLEFSLGVGFLDHDSNDIEAFVTEMDHNMLKEKQKKHIDR